MSLLRCYAAPLFAFLDAYGAAPPYASAMRRSALMPLMMMIFRRRHAARHDITFFSFHKSCRHMRACYAAVTRYLQRVICRAMSCRERAPLHARRLRAARVTQAAR